MKRNTAHSWAPQVHSFPLSLPTVDQALLKSLLGGPFLLHPTSPPIALQIKMNPILVRSVVVVASATIGGILSPILVTAGLGAIGFGVAGPVAGSVAAGMQAGIGNVVAGSLFSVVQSVAMGGALAGAVTTAASAVGAIVGACVTAAAVIL